MCPLLSSKFAKLAILKIAKRLLADNKKPLEKIAPACEVGPVDTLQRTFRQETGTDSVFRRPKMSLLYRSSRNHSKKGEQKLRRKCRRLSGMQ